jgi:hypothetical protein
MHVRMHAHALMQIQVLLLADRLRAERALCAAVNALLATADTSMAGVLDWDTILALYALPPAVAKSKALKPLWNAGAAALQHRLGDLDAAWLDAGCRAQLLALPFEALRHLLSDERTRVSSENTVVYTVAAWINDNAGGVDGAMQRAALAHYVRAPHLSKLYCASAGSWLLTRWSPHISAADVHCATDLQEADDSSKLRTRLLKAKGLPLAHRSAWRLPPRPTSSVKEAVVEWRVPLSEMRQLYEQAAAGAEVGESLQVCSEAVVFQGCEWEARVKCKKREAGVILRATLNVSLPPGCGAAAVLAAMVAFQKKPPADDAHDPALRFSAWSIEVGTGQGCTDVFGLGELKEWDEVAWRNKGLVGQDGRVGVRFTIRGVK